MRLPLTDADTLIHKEKYPVWAKITAAYCCVLQAIFYVLTELVVTCSNGTIHMYIPKIPAIDDHIPLIPVFIIIYWYSYVYWVYAILRTTKTDRKYFSNWLIALTVSEFIGFIIFCVYPTTMDRFQEGLFSIATKPGFCNRLTWFTYAFDGERWGHNLFPSYHCMFSTTCYIGVRKNRRIPRWQRIYSLVVTLLIYMSTLFTKQHFFIDVAGGICISIICNILAQKLNPGKYLKLKFLDNLSQEQ